MEINNAFQIFIVDNVTSFPKCPRTLQNHLWLWRIGGKKMAISHFCPWHFAQCYNLQICPKHACTWFTGSNPFYNHKLNANTLDIGLILSYGALHKELFQKWQEVHIATLIKHSFSNFVYLEHWTQYLAANKVHEYQEKFTNYVYALS